MNILSTTNYNIIITLKNQPHHQPAAECRHMSGKEICYPLPSTTKVLTPNYLVLPRSGSRVDNTCNKGNKAEYIKYGYCSPYVIYGQAVLHKKG